MTKEHPRQFIHGLTAKEDFEQIQQEKLHRRDQHALNSGQLLLFQHRQHPDILEKNKKLVEQSCLTQFVQLFNFFSRIQPLGDLYIIAHGQLPA